MQYSMRFRRRLKRFTPQPAPLVVVEVQVHEVVVRDKPTAPHVDDRV